MDKISIIEQLKLKINTFSPQEGLKYLAMTFPKEVVFSTSLGQEDQVITQMIHEIQADIKIFTLDTGRLFPETLNLLHQTQKLYNQTIHVYYPERDLLEAYVNQHGINGFYQSVENRKECCRLRKVIPLHRALQGHKVWVTGLRAEQSANRSEMKILEWDEDNQMIKYNPLLNWGYDEVIEYLHKSNIPYNPLHDQGFLSIGCAPCTRAILPGEDVRAGRWWWESSKKECGLHSKY
jgi:phosphoadenosine phosphosulfate reductase